MYTDMLCRESNDSVPHKSNETTFFFENQGEQYQEISVDGNQFMNATDCVEFLDSLPFQNSDIDEEDIEYYDSIIET